MVNIDGVRDKLRVLLVSGKPHPGERMWRNLLKSDANVDLVHFTILRPPEKGGDGVPINELSLIAFPVADLFGRKIKDFDLIIFDRYAQQSILPFAYLENIAEYVRDGGALLMAEGPEFSTPDGLYLLAARGDRAGRADRRRPRGAVPRRRFPELGLRHPVTRGLGGDAGGNRAGAAGSGCRREGDRRPDGDERRRTTSRCSCCRGSTRGASALLLSDQMWLWARGYDGGGPYLDLLRRLAHWLMKEPDLEEEALRASAKGARVTVERQSVSGAARDTFLIAPDGDEDQARLDARRAGPQPRAVTVDRFGLYRAEDGEHVALVNVGPENPLEMRDVVSTTGKLRPLAEATGGLGAPARRRRRRRRDMPRIVALNPAPSYARQRLHRDQADGGERTDRRALDLAGFRLLRAGAAARRGRRRLAGRSRPAWIADEPDTDPKGRLAARRAAGLGNAGFCWGGPSSEKSLRQRRRGARRQSSRMA